MLKTKLLQYINEKPVALFQSNALENKWTKGDIYAFFNSIGYDTTNKGQLQAGVIIMRKNFYTTQLIDNWYYICHNHYELINDDISKFPNSDTFVENRHDQAIFSILANNYPCTYWPVSEIWTNGDWESLGDKPIWVTRSKEENVKLFKRIKRKVKAILKKYLKI